MRGALNPLPQYAFMAWCLVKHRDNVTFYIYVICPIAQHTTDVRYDTKTSFPPFSPKSLSLFRFHISLFDVFELNNTQCRYNH
jgi:hypothetical protein